MTRLEKLREWNTSFTAREVSGAVIGVAERCGDSAVIVRKCDSVNRMKKSSLNTCYMFAMDGKRASKIYPHIIGMDDAIAGVTVRAWKGKPHNVLVYDYEKMLSVHMESNKWDMEQAVEWSDFNDNAWHGPTTPLVMRKLSFILGG